MSKTKSTYTVLEYGLLRDTEATLILTYRVSIPTTVQKIFRDKECNTCIAPYQDVKVRCWSITVCSNMPYFSRKSLNPSTSCPFLFRFDGAGT